MNYKITSQSGISVVTFQGGIEKGDKEALTQCAQDLLTDDVKSVVLFFKEVDNIDNIALRDLTLLQHNIRQKNIPIRLTVSNNMIKTLLIDKGVVRTSELSNTISEAILAASRLP